MAAPLIMRKTLRGLEPANDLAADILRKVKLGDTVRVDIKRPRSLQWHKRYWVLVGMISDNSPYTPDEVHALIKLRCGCAKIIQERNGNITCIPDSIAFNKMDGIAWAQFWERVVDYVAADLLPGVPKETLASELAQLVGVAA